MALPTNHRFFSLFASISKWASVFSVFMGCVVLAGWALDVDPLRNFSTGMSRMRANAAIAFVLAGISLWLLAREEEPRGNVLRAARTLAFFVALLGLLTLSEYLFGWDAGIDQLLVKVQVAAASPFPPGRMVPHAAVNFALVGMALLFLTFPRGHWTASFLSIAAAAISMLALMGYAYATELHGSGPTNMLMSTYTAMTFLVLSIGALFGLRDRGLMTILASDRAGGATARRILPAIILVPMLLGWLRMQGYRAGLLSDEFGVALMVTAIMLILLALVWWNSISMDRIDEGRRQFESALRGSTELLEKIFSNIHLNVAYLDPDFNFIRVNQAYADACGYPPEFFPGKKHFDLYPHAENEAIFRKVVKTGEPFHILAKPFEFPDHPERRVTYWDWSLLPLMEPEGKVGGLIFCLVDVTERRKAEMELRESEERFRVLVEHSPVGIFIVQGGRIVYRNPEQRRLFGLVEENLEFKDFGDIHPEDAAKFGEICAAVSGEDGKTPEVDLRFYPRGKSAEGTDLRWVQMNTCQIEFGEEKAILVSMVDITRAKEMEHLAKVREKLASLGQVAAGIAHEIRNPLSGINIYLSSLEKIHDDAGMEEEELGQAGKILGQIRSASGRIESVVKKVMEFSRPAAPRLGLKDINPAIEDAIEFTATTVRKCGITLDRSNLKHLPMCHADPNLLAQVLMNLINNAAQAMANKEGLKIIGISSEAEPGRIVIRVFDSGPGVPPSLREKIFDPFYTTRKEGYGIGLSFSKQVIVAHGGTLMVDTSPWGGAEFRIELPTRDEQASA
jgi:PAS domain S-box-containing protein